MIYYWLSALQILFENRHEIQVSSTSCGSLSDAKIGRHWKGKVFAKLGRGDIVFFAVRKRASVRTEREKALSRLRRRPQPGALTLRIPQDNSIFSSSRKRRMESLFSSPRTSCLDLFLIDHFPLLTSQDSARSGLWSETGAWSPPSGSWDGEKWKLGGRHHALVSHLLSGQAIFDHVFGAGHGKMGREMLTCRGNQELPWTELGGLEAWGLLNIIQTTLALEDRVKMRALP